MESIRWGIIGAGSIADTVAGEFAFVPQAELAAVASRDLERSRRLARKHGIPAIHRDYRALIESDGVDVVYIATTHPHHRDIALAAISAGKAVMVEKSFTATLAGTEQVVEAATTAGVFAMEAMWTRRLPERSLRGEGSGRCSACRATCVPSGSTTRTTGCGIR